MIASLKKNKNFKSFQLPQVRSLKTAIAKASSLDEIERLNQMLRNGTVSICLVQKLGLPLFENRLHSIFQMPGMKPKEGVNGEEMETE